MGKNQPSQAGSFYFWHTGLLTHVPCINDWSRSRQYRDDSCATAAHAKKICRRRDTWVTSPDAQSPYCAPLQYSTRIIDFPQRWRRPPDDLVFRYSLFRKIQNVYVCQTYEQKKYSPDPRWPLEDVATKICIQHTVLHTYAKGPFSWSFFSIPLSQGNKWRCHIQYAICNIPYPIYYLNFSFYLILLLVYDKINWGFLAYNKNPKAIELLIKENPKKIIWRPPSEGLKKCCDHQAKVNS